MDGLETTNLMLIVDLIDYCNKLVIFVCSKL